MVRFLEIKPDFGPNFPEDSGDQPGSFFHHLIMKNRWNPLMTESTILGRHHYKMGKNMITFKTLEVDHEVFQISLTKQCIQNSNVLHSFFIHSNDKLESSWSIWFYFCSSYKVPMNSTFLSFCLWNHQVLRSLKWNNFEYKLKVGSSWSRWFYFWRISLKWDNFGFKLEVESSWSRWFYFWSIFEMRQYQIQTSIVSIVSIFEKNQIFKMTVSWWKLFRWNFLCITPNMTWCSQ